MVDFIGIERVQELVARRGTARFIAAMLAGLRLASSATRSLARLAS